MLSKNLNIVITGGSGFIGQHLLKSIEFRNCNIRNYSLRQIDVKCLDLDSVDIVIHMAGLTSVKNLDDKNVIFKINEDLTIALAKHAKRNNVKHFIFLSTTKVFGDNSNKLYYKTGDKCVPTDDYGRSKLNAEDGILKLSSTMFKISIVRPAIVYGAEVKGNLNSLMQLIIKGFPLPFDHVDNLRSMTYVGNLIHHIAFQIKNNLDGIFLVTDNNDLSTSDLIMYLKMHLGVSTKTFKAPFLLRKILELTNPNMYNRLFGSLVYFVNDEYEKIGFIPPFKPSEGIARMAIAFKNSNK